MDAQLDDLPLEAPGLAGSSTGACIIVAHIGCAEWRPSTSDSSMDCRPL